MDEWLRAARHACATAPPEAGKAAEWLLDNDYQVHRAIRQIRQDLPPAFYGHLPAEPSGAGPRYPRIFGLAHLLLKTTRLQLSLAGAVRFIDTYPSADELTIAELWAFPTMLRIACLEILIAALTPLLAPRVALPFEPSHFASGHSTIDPTERVARGIANLGVIAAIPWDEFFDAVSRVERTLGQDPAAVYRDMDFETRDAYRRAVEELARFGRLDEHEVAVRAVALSADAASETAERHVGYWLVDHGRSRLIYLAGARLPLRHRLQDFIRVHPGPTYAGFLIVCAIGALLPPAFYLTLLDAGRWAWLTGLAAAFVPATILAVTFVHWAITRTLPPRILPKLDSAKGLPKGCPTAVAIPVIVTDPDQVAGIVDQMETHWLANADPNIRIVLLADLADAPAEHDPRDAAILRLLKAEVRALNGRYRRRPFHLLVRPRRYNPAEGCWMAWERKRGKLEQFNRLIIEGDHGPFALRVGREAALKAVRFVVTVDADTMLPTGSVARLAATLAHPLNQPRTDASGRTARGYTIIQPRTEISPQSGKRTLFTRLFTGDTAIDIYSRAVSDVYQDLFGAGIFVGKGIYDVRAFHRSVDGRVPENSILSHDLFEGAHGRVGLATDIVLYEGFPATYLEYARRLHRWIRGDWQLLPWLGRKVPAADGAKMESAFAGIDRWKIFDNLRRSLVAPSMLALALAGWFFLPGAPWFWTLLAIFAPAGQLFTDLISGLARGRRRGAVRGLVLNFSDQAGRWFLAIVFLLHEALLSLDAIGLTVWRLLVTHRKLLEWAPAAQVAANLSGSGTRGALWRQMWAGPALAGATAILVLVYRPESADAALPLLLLWIAAPEITFRIGRPPRQEAAPLAAADLPALRMLARRTWLFFETFAGPEDHWLPPDNYQDEPYPEIAHRTSPTNIGMLLLAGASAWDLGYIGRHELAARAENVFDSLDRLERYRGHFFNWYDTISLKPLEPRYLSSVDSGNLAGCLIAFAAALEEAAETAQLEWQRWLGLTDVVDLLERSAAVVPQIALGERLERLRAAIRTLAPDPSSWLFGLSDICDGDIPAIEEAVAKAFATPEAAAPAGLREVHVWLKRLRHQAAAMLRDLGEPAGVAATLRALSARARAFAEAMDFRPLYDRERRLLYIGRNLTTGRTDPHHYDLLASEARLASLFAIAKGDVPLEHWFHLERPVLRHAGKLALISWNGSMFEYLMPRLLLRCGPETLLGESERIAVRLQRLYGAENGVPWGISESAFASRDAEHRYRYQAFGVPGLGLKRGLGRDMVVAPYASALALPVAPAAAAANLAALESLGGSGLYGVMEAVDFTPERTAGERCVPVKAWMAHHQGMILCAIGNAVADDILVQRFARDGRIRLVSLLLNERIPREIPPEIDRIEAREREPVAAAAPPRPTSWEVAPSPAFPEMQFLGNGRLASWITEAGSGGLRWRGHALTRFVPDATLDADGLWLYLADRDSGALWSATRQPTQVPAREYGVRFHGHMAEFHRRDHDIETRLEVGVGAGDDLELRRLVLVNESAQPRRLRVTSFAEVSLARPLEDERHPTFSKLFAGSEPVPTLGGLLFTRRTRERGETAPCLLHFAVDGDGPVTRARFCGDRAAFLGRGGTARRPAGASTPLGNSSGFTLDAAAALQIDIDLDPFERCELCFVTVAATSRETAVEIAERHATLAALDWILSDAASDAARIVEHARLDPAHMREVASLGSQLVYPHGPLRAGPHLIAANHLGQVQLWGLALSGDLPILLLRARAGATLLPFLVRAHQYWRRFGLESDLVVLQSGGSAYVEPVRSELSDLLRELGAEGLLAQRGGVHLLFADQIGGEQVRLLEAAAHVVLDDGRDMLEQLASPAHQIELPGLVPSRAPGEELPDPPLTRPNDLRFANRLGGFTPDGREYLIHLDPGMRTPAPWANVIANDGFGTLVTEAGGGFSWAGNSGENRLTPWTNDPVADRPGEILYLRDEESATVWTVTPQPAGAGSACQIRHGAGYTIWRRHSHALEQEMLVAVAPDDPVKLIRLRLRNLTSRHRRLTSTYYAEWLLGALASASRPHIVCSRDQDDDILLATNPWSTDFGTKVAFLGATRAAHGFTTDRREFLGREGDLARPAGLERWGLGGRIVAGRDPCAAYQVHHDLAPGDVDEVVFLLGQAESAPAAAALVAAWRRPHAVARALDDLEKRWNDLLGATEVHTPDPAFDVMVNRWLLYQATASRLLARTGFYQSSGAYGFRDQLQDVLALLHADPARARAHILRCAAHQFPEGDVLHWWHPPADRGVRTRCSDDLAWLPYAAAVYVRATGDGAILDEHVPFLSGERLSPEEKDRYARFDSGGKSSPLIDHLERALEHALTRGSHGLPLMAAGDWNDGMDRVGDAGRGESVWLGWFLSVTCALTADVARRTGRAASAMRWQAHAAELRARVESAGWDGAWYRRAFDDEGRPLGAAGDDECRIDSISQSWSVFAGAEPLRTGQALAAAKRELVDPGHRLARLLWPPFDRGERDPGYIKAYPPGVRENGGQYAHAAAWLGLAFAASGDGKTAHDIFSMISPVGRDVDGYRVEPYVVAGDVRTAPPGAGHGGWTWYSGAAAWAWRLGVEGILGLRLDDGALSVAPCLPPAWRGYRATVRRGDGTISIEVEDPGGLGSGRVQLMLDGKPWQGPVPFPPSGTCRLVATLHEDAAAAEAQPPAAEAR